MGIMSVDKCGVIVCDYAIIKVGCQQHFCSVTPYWFNDIDILRTINKIIINIYIYLVISLAMQHTTYYAPQQHGFKS